MRKLACLITLFAMTPPVLAVKRVTVDQLQQFLLAERGHQDAEVARVLSNLQLTEALSLGKLASWQADVPGSEARQALTVLADESAFLDPPSRDLPTLPTPDLAEQRRIMALAVNYVSNTLHQLPNFFATRETLHYEDTPQGTKADLLVPYQPLRPVSSSTATITYRDGEEAMEAAMGKTPQRQSGLNTSGEFGNILNTTLLDGAQSLAWSRWEQGAGGPEAVFRYTVPRAKSHYRLTFCCVSQGNGSQIFQQYSGYHGEIAIDPASGVILRLTLEADLKPSDSILKADILVDYAPVQIGDKTFICPVRSISLSALPAEAFQPKAINTSLGALLKSEALRTSQLSNTEGALIQSPPGALKNLLNEVTFTHYHLFGADARILSGDVAPPPSNTLPTQQTSKTIAADLSPAASAPPPATEKPQPTATAPPSPTAANADTSPAPGARLTPPPPPVVPEISVVATTRIPTLPLATSGDGFALHAAARLVELSVVAYDATGLPVTDLKANDLELLDNGRPQKIRIAAYPGGATTSTSAAPEFNDPASQPIFSNQSPKSLAANKKSGNDGPVRSEPSIIVLLIDSANLSWSDLSNARRQMLRFLHQLPADQQLALYILKADGFQALQDQTADHALLVAKLSHWMRNAADLSQAQEEERRNRQQMDYVRHKSDLQYVNGNMISAPETFQPPDPQLRDNASNAGRDALTTLVGLARHFAAVPGHKNLVWITSDNVLADWADKAVGSDKGSKHVEGYVLRAQEALNDAQIALFPLDASQLEGGSVSAALQNASIQVDPGAVDPPAAPNPGQPASHATSNSRGAPGGRNLVAMEQDVHAIQGPIREMADATGGRALRRSSDMVSALNHVAEDGRATYLLSFVPDSAADNQYHSVTLKLATRRGVTLRYRTGYLASTEPSTFQERFQRALWQPVDLDGIVMSAIPSTTGAALTVKLGLAADDLALEQQNGRWVDKLDLFFAQRDNQGRSARLIGQAVALALTPATYQKLKAEGLPFSQTLDSAPDMGSIRVLVVDENSGRIGSITLPASSLQGQSRR